VRLDCSLWLHKVANEIKHDSMWGEGGAPTRLLGPLGLWCGKILERGGESSLDLSYLR
jgi:hypothetical protein